MAVMEIILKAVDQVSGTVQNIAQSTGQAGNFMEQNWMAIGAGAAVAGGAMEAAARKQAPLTEQTRQVAAAMGMAEGEIRALALATTDVTFPLEEVIGLFETGREQGIKSADQLQEYAKFWDMVGDATGENAVMLSEAGVGLRAVGIAAGEEQEALNAFGYITEETTGDVGEFLSFIERTGPQLREMGADVDDAAAIMGVLEKEFGMTARTARQEFRKAVNEADGDMGVMLETLGISEEKFGEYSQAVEGSSDIIERNAAIHGESYTAMEKLQQKAGELTYKYGDLIGVVGNFGPLMMGLGPIIKGVSLAKGVLGKVSLGAVVPGFLGAAKAAWAFTAALLANPITWIVIAVIALIAAIYLLWKNWDQVSAWLANSWEWIKEKAQAIFGGIADFFSNFGENVKAIFSRVWDAIKDIFGWSPIGLIAGNWDTIKDYFGGLWDRIKEALGTAWEWIKGVFAFSPIGLIAGNWDQIAEFFSGLWERIKDVFSRALGGIIDLFFKYHPLGIIITHWDEITDFLGKAWERIKEIFSAALGAIRTWVQDRLAAIKEDIVNQFTAAGEFISEAWENIKQTTADALAAIIAWVQDRLTAMKETIVERITEAREFISQAWEQIKEIFSAALDAVVGFIRTKFENAKSNITNAWNAIKDFFATTWASIKQLFSGALGDIIQSIAGWAGDLAAKAREAGGNLVNGFIDAVKGLPGRLWGILMDAVKKLINVGGQLWTAAKNAGEKIWSGIKKGLGKSSPGHIERAIDEISNRAAKLPKEMAQSFSQIKGLDATPGAKIAVQGLGAGAGPADSVAGAPAMEWADLSSEQKAQIEKAAMAAEKQMMDSMGKTYATLTAEEKNQVMARGREVEQEMMESLNRRESALTERIKKMTGKVADMTGLAVKAQQIREDIKQRAEQAVEVASSLDAKAQQIRADLESRAGAMNGSNAMALATPSAGGDSIVHNHFHISDIVIRDDRDIEDLAKQLYALWKKRERGVS